MAAQFILNLLFDKLSCVSELNGNKIYTTIGDKKYRCMFLYRETNPEKNVLFDGNRLKWIYGFIGEIAIDYKEYKGYYVRFHEESLESDINTYDYIVRSPKINILEIVESIPDQEKFPFPKYEEKIDVLPDEEINFSVFENYDLQQYRVIFDLIKMCHTSSNIKLSDDNIKNSILLFKEFKYQRMKTIMESSSLYTRESISSCCYLSMQIIKEYPAFKFDWELVTANVGAIYDRDILANPDYPWSLKQIQQERLLPSSFLKRRFKEYRQSHYDYDEKKEWKLFDLIMTPEECPYNDDEELNDINEEEIEEAYKLLQENSPELFVDCSNEYPSIIKKSITEMIKLNGCFIIDDFIFPDDIFEEDSEDDDRNDQLQWLKNFNRSNNKEFNEEYIRECIEKNKTDEDNYTYTTDYRSIMGIDIRSGIVTREDYENYLLSNRYLYNVEKCIHFKREDLDNFPQFFDKIAKNIRLSLGEITLLDILEDPYYDWDINLIIKKLPLYDVFNYFLFYPTLLLLLGYNKYRIDTIFLQKNSWLISEFVKREDFSQDYKLAFLYPHIKWFSNRLFFTRLPAQLNIIDENKYDPYDIYDKEYKSQNICTWDFLKTSDGILLLDKNCDLSKYSSLSDKEKEMYIFSFFRRNRELFSSFSDIIPNHLITSEMKFKFSAPSDINLNLQMDFIKDKNLDVLTAISFISHSQDSFLLIERNFIMLAVKIINYGKSIGENTDFLYLTALKFIEMISTLFPNKKSYNDSHKFYKITDNFTLDEINSSIYANPVAMIKKIVNYKKSNDEDQDFDDSDIKDNSV